MTDSKYDLTVFRSTGFIESIRNEAQKHEMDPSTQPSAVQAQLSSELTTPSQIPETSLAQNPSDNCQDLPQRETNVGKSIESIEESVEKGAAPPNRRLKVGLKPSWTVTTTGDKSQKRSSQEEMGNNNPKRARKQKATDSSNNNFTPRNLRPRNKKI